MAKTFLFQPGQKVRVTTPLSTIQKGIGRDLPFPDPIGEVLSFNENNNDVTICLHGDNIILKAGELKIVKEIRDAREGN